MAEDGSPPLPRARLQSIAKGFRIYRGAMLSVIVFSIAINLLMLTIPIYLLQISDRVLLSRSTDTLILLTVVAVGAITLLAVLDTLRRIILVRVAARADTELGGPVLAASVAAAVKGTSGGDQGLRDLAQIRAFVTSPMLPLMIDIFMVPVYGLVIFMVHFQLGALTTVGAVVLLFLALANQALTAKATRGAGQHSMSAMAAAQASTRNAEVIQAMGMLPEAIDFWGRANAAAIAAQKRAGGRNAVVTGFSRLTRLGLQIAILGWGAYLAVQGEITGGMMIAASMIGSRALQPIEGTIEGWRNYLQFRQANRRVRELLKSGLDESEATQLPEPHGEIVAQDLVYAVAGVKKPLINKVTFGIRPGDSVAIIGASGAGKSTLLRLLVGAHIPTDGTVRLDGADIFHWDRIAFGRYTGYLPQDVELFPGTVAHNIARLKSDATSEEIVEAARMAGAHQLISRLPDGYGTQIRLGGAPLSGGQRQRIALARAFFRVPKFVALDEPDANLDSEGEQALMQALMRAKRRGTTTVTVSQRPLLLQFVDKILLLRAGRVQAYGPRDSILPRLLEQTKKRQIAHQADGQNLVTSAKRAVEEGNADTSPGKQRRRKTTRKKNPPSSEAR